MLKSLGLIPSTSKKEERKGGREGETEGTEGDDRRGEEYLLVAYSYFYRIEFFKIKTDRPPELPESLSLMKEEALWFSALFPFLGPDAQH